MMTDRYQTHTLAAWQGFAGGKTIGIDSVGNVNYTV